MGVENDIMIAIGAKQAGRQELARMLRVLRDLGIEEIARGSASTKTPPNAPLISRFLTHAPGSTVDVGPGGERTEKAVKELRTEVRRGNGILERVARGVERESRRIPVFNGR